LSERKMPAKMPRGTDTTEAIRTRMSVPTIALEIPPPDSPIGLGSSVMKCQLMEEAPRMMMNRSMRIRGTVARRDSANTSARKEKSPRNRAATPASRCSRERDFVAILTCRHSVHDYFSRDIDQSADHEQKQGDLNEARQIHVA